MASDSHQGTMATSTAQPQPAGDSSSTGAGTATQQLQQQQQPAAEQPKKAKRKRITPEQLEDLVGLFEKTDTPSFEIRESLAKKLGMTNREIQVWFQNRRAKANRVKINEQAALHHQQHLQMQQQQHQQQHLQGHHHPQHPHHHRSNSHNGFGFHPNHVHSAPATPQQPSPHHHSHSSHASHHHPGSTGSSSAPLAAQDNASFGYFGPNGSSSPTMVMPTPTPRVHSSSSHGHASRRPASLYNIGSYGHHLQTQQFQQQKPLGSFQPQHPSPSGHYGQAAPSHGAHAHGHAAHGHAHSSSYSQPASPYGMDIILPASASSSASASSQQRPVLPPPISTLPQSHRPAHHDDYQDPRRVHRHSRTMSDSHPTDYMSPTSISPVSPPPERPLDSHYRDDYEDDSPSSATHSSSPFANGASGNSSGNVNRHSTSLASFGLKQPSIKTEDHASFGLKQPVLKTEEPEPNVVPRERQPAHAYYNNAAQAARNRRSYDDALYDEHQQLMRDNFNMDTRLVISEDEPRPESAIDLLAYAAAYIQESEEHKKDGEEKRDGLGHLSSSNKRQSFHGPTGYPSKEPFQEDRYSSSSMAWEASPPAGSSNDVMPIPRRRGGDDGPYATRRPRPVTYGGSGFLYDHQENQFMPQSPSSSLLSYGRSSSSFGSSSRRVGNRNSNDIGGSQLLLQRGLTRPRRSSSTAASNNNNHSSSNSTGNGSSSNGMLGHHHMSPSSTMPVLPPIINENQQLLSPAMVPSPPPFGGSRLSRQDSGSNTRDSPGSDSFSRDSYNDSHASSRDDMEDIEDEETEFNRLRAAKRRSGNNAFFGMNTD
ncbi:hypothetical protein BGZ68_006317 [Mortierella alpina]|nr:hypothetical protein BGZ68_006317 [Mortierella alpina]